MEVGENPVKAMRLWLFGAVLGVMLAGLAGCSTVAAGRSQPPTASITQVEFEGVSFTLPTTIAAAATPQRIPPVPAGNGPGPAAPAALRFSFDARGAPDYVAPDAPQLLIYRVEEIQALPGFEENLLRSLVQLLDSPTALPSIAPRPLPVLPSFNLGQPFSVQQQTLDFAGGRGVRFVSFFTSAPAPLQLTYSFQGLTDDRQYYVAFYFPVSADGLPDPAEPGSEAWPGYLTAVQDQLATQPAAAFAPDLTVLDELIGSLTIQ